MLMCAKKKTRASAEGRARWEGGGRAYSTTAGLAATDSPDLPHHKPLPSQTERIGRLAKG